MCIQYSISIYIYIYCDSAGLRTFPGSGLSDTAFVDSCSFESGSTSPFLTILTATCS